MFKVLFVNGDENIVQNLKGLVSWERYNCVVVGESYDGINGMAQVRQLEPNILFFDICMPDMDGLAMFAELHGEYPDMQAAIVTDCVEFECAQKAVNLGVTRYLLKPAKTEDLDEAISAMIYKLGGETPAVDSLVVRSALQFLKENCASRLRLQDVADHVYVSQGQLGKLLKKHTGENFLGLLQRYRVDMAKHLLRDPSLRVSDVAYKTGFTDATHFSKVFKRIAGQSARVYRNQSEKN